MPEFYKPDKSTTDAYATDSGHEYFGKAPAGTNTVTARWVIFKMEFNGSNWIIKYPADPTTGKGTDAPKFKWDDVLILTYRILGTIT